MLKRTILAILVVMMVTGTAFGQRITESLSNWTMGTNQPEISSGARGDGSTGDYMHLPIGTSPTYYEVMEEGEGIVEFWIYDPSICLEETNPGYSTRGCGWGLQSPLYQSGYIAIDRASYVAGCQGYSPWSTVQPYSPRWYISGLRGHLAYPWTAQWIKWSVNGTWDDMTFTTYDVNYDNSGTMLHGDPSMTIDATTWSNAWEALFGEGWKAFIVKGDGSSGIEDISVDVSSGTGVFSEYATSVSGQYERATWSDIKYLYR